jgi:hypothetical protein
MKASLKLLKITSIAVMLASLAACGGSDTNSNTNTNEDTKTGTFIDSPVANLGYRTETKTGKTNTSGEFEYKPGETVTFSIGNLDFPSALAKLLITPFDLAGTSDINDPTVIRIARLLQSLDLDGDPENGIVIGDEAHDILNSVQLEIDANDFYLIVESILVDSGTSNEALVDEATALLHLQNATDLASDTVPPVITLTGSNLETVIQNQTYSEQGAVAVDAIDGLVSVTTSGSVDTSTIGTYSITYTAIDGAGNTVSVTRTIVVVEASSDYDAPVIALNGASEVSLTEGETYTELGASATDLVDGVVGVVVTSEVDTAVSGTYLITYTATDNAGNTVSVTRTVLVMEAPLLTDVDGDGYYLEQDDCDDDVNAINPGAEELNTDLIDSNCDGALSVWPFVVGDYGPAGGYVFYVANGQFILEAAPENQGGGVSAEWGCNSIRIPGASGKAIGTGAKNTVDMLSAGCSPTAEDIELGAILADEYSFNGFDDWYLPAKDELTAMYALRLEIGGFGDFAYMTSSQIDAETAWSQNGVFGMQANIRSALRKVRIIRATYSTDDLDFDGYSPDQGDCNDNDSAINPAADEKNNDLIDSNCDDNREISSAPYIIGDYGPGGGIVFYIGDSGASGLEVAPGALGNAAWGCSDYDKPVVTGAYSRSIGGGNVNTKSILEQCNEEGTAARLASNFEYGGFADWFLPSIEELSAMAVQKDHIGDFSKTVYWSSTHDEFSNWNAWLMQNGYSTFPYFKHYDFGVRAIRVFGDTDADADGYYFDADCDDTNDLVSEGHREISDDMDNDCDGEIDNGFRVIVSTINGGYVVARLNVPDRTQWDLKNCEGVSLCSFSLEGADNRIFVGLSGSGSGSFSHWKGDIEFCSRISDGGCLFDSSLATLNRDAELVAVWNEPSLPPIPPTPAPSLVVEAQTGGRVLTGDDIYCEEQSSCIYAQGDLPTEIDLNDGGKVVDTGTVSPFVAIAEPGYLFNGWEGSVANACQDRSSTSDVCSLYTTLDGEENLVATFVLIPGDVSNIPSRGQFFRLMSLPRKGCVRVKPASILPDITEEITIINDCPLHEKSFLFQRLASKTDGAWDWQWDYLVPKGSGKYDRCLKVEADGSIVNSAIERCTDADRFKFHFEPASGFSASDQIYNIRMKQGGCIEEGGGSTQEADVVGSTNCSAHESQLFKVIPYDNEREVSGDRTCPRRGSISMFFYSTEAESWDCLQYNDLSFFKFGDFNGDGITDVFTISASDAWLVSLGGSGAFESLGGEGTISDDFGNLKLGDFTGDGKTDVFTIKDGNWYLSESGTELSRKINRSSTPLDDLVFGYFDNDKKIDVLRQETNGNWQIISAGVGNLGSDEGDWVDLGGQAEQQNFIYFSMPRVLSNHRFGDFTGDGQTDIFSRRDTGEWVVASSEWGWDFRSTGESSTIALSRYRFGDFNGDSITDILYWQPDGDTNTGNWRFSSAAKHGWHTFYNHLTLESQLVWPPGDGDTWPRGSAAMDFDGGGVTDTWSLVNLHAPVPESHKSKIAKNVWEKFQQAHQADVDEVISWGGADTSNYCWWAHIQGLAKIYSGYVFAQNTCSDYSTLIYLGIGRSYGLFDYDSIPTYKFGNSNHPAAMQASGSLVVAPMENKEPKYGKLTTTYFYDFTDPDSPRKLNFVIAGEKSNPNPKSGAAGIVYHHLEQKHYVILNHQLYRSNGVSFASAGIELERLSEEETTVNTACHEDRREPVYSQGGTSLIYEEYEDDNSIVQGRLWVLAMDRCGPINWLHLSELKISDDGESYKVVRSVQKSLSGNGQNATVEPNFRWGATVYVTDEGIEIIAAAKNHLVKPVGTQLRRWFFSN